jgi:energy-coupling factor transport system ATP-binding protein
MEDVAKYVDRILVMNNGSLAMDQKTRNVFARYKELEEIHLAAPQVTYVMNALKEKGFSFNTDVTTVAEAKNEILKGLKK